jgi:hypothetical protein
MNATLNTGPWDKIAEIPENRAITTALQKPRRRACWVLASVMAQWSHLPVSVAARPPVNYGISARWNARHSGG